ncbi:hypothetical protein BAE44_0024608 [Dichanthelium oligosanthes]|uniref:Uncharacterized protein n=1 Tax=Dichanthelium oligosanthes TaxID=888268 RepID=A0A1E5UNK4_9POAL|nr:hypothetical protein BAE44_0024608 [Dichanthelium oligosanthes]
MDRISKPEAEAEAGGQFEALVYRKPFPWRKYSWACDILPPPPPYIGDTTSHSSCLEISSYAVLKGGSQICVSVDGAGTYCLDTASYAWSEVGRWTLPFHGKAEYVPELKLWFGFSAKDQHLAAADLSTMDSQPQLLDSLKELDLPKRWQQVQDPQLVNLGSGRFCVARFLQRTPGRGVGDGSSHRSVTVLTGVEVAIAYGFAGKVNLGMVKHKSRFHKSSCGEDTITAVL